MVKGSEIHKLLGHTECVSSLKFDEIRLLVLLFNLVHVSACCVTCMCICLLLPSKQSFIG